MKTILLTLLLLPITLFSQNDVIYDVASIPPKYPGGNLKMSEFIAKHFEYPEIAREMGEQGTIWVEFVVYSDGNIRYAKVVKGVSASLDAESIRVIELMPKWKPGEQAGKKVNVRFTIPIKAKLGLTKGQKSRKKEERKNR